MKYIELKTIKGEGPEAFEYRSTLLTILREAPVPQGITFGEMEKALGVAKKIEDGNGYAVLDDSEHVYLWERLRTFGWPKANPIYFDLCKAVRDAADKKPEESGA